MPRIVVVGAGLAGHRTVTSLREQGFDGEIVVVGDERYKPYDRPPLSKQLLAGRMPCDSAFFATDGLDVRWVLGIPATGLDVSARTITLAGGADLEYDGLVVATGRRAKPWPGTEERAGVHTLRSLDDAMALRLAVYPSTQVVIIGAGFIGCEVAATLRSLNVDSVTIVDVAAHPMPVLGVEVGRRAAALHAAHGVQLRLASGVTSIDVAEHVESVTLTDGTSLPADLVLVATGSMPNSEWLADSGVDLVSGAVRCDENCAVLGPDGTPLAMVVAAGDIAAWPHRHANGGAVIEHWSNARDMAALAAATLLGRPAEKAPAPVPSFWSDQYDVKIKSVGYLRAADRFEVVAEDIDRPSLVVEAYRDDELVAAVVFNMNRRIIDYQRRLALAAEAGALQ